MRKTITVDEYLTMIDEWHNLTVNQSVKIGEVNKLHRKIYSIEEKLNVDFFLDILENNKFKNDWQLLKIAGRVYFKNKDFRMVEIIKELLTSEDLYTRLDAQTFFMVHKDLK
jgi:hypothetical protein